MEYEDKLKFTQDIREKWIDTLTKQGQSMPEDFKTGSILNMILDGMDKATLTMRKIKSDEGISDKATKAVEILAEIYNTTKRSDLLANNITGEKGQPKFLSDDITHTSVEGELDLQPHKLKFETFMPNEDK